MADSLLYNDFAITIGAAESKQLCFMDHLGSFTWELNPASGVANLGNNRVYDVNLLGSYNSSSNQWRWYWGRLFVPHICTLFSLIPPKAPSPVA